MATPLFIVLLLFDGTKRFFEAWVAQLANYALVGVLAVLTASLLMTVVETYAVQTAAKGAAILTVDALDMLLVAGLVSWVALRGAALAHRRAQIATRVPLENLWQTIGSCGKPPRDDSSTFATVAIVVTVGAWLVFPLLVVVAFVL